MASSSADVSTEHASKYLQQLCKHWTHKMATEFDPQRGRVEFPSGAVLHLEAQPAVLLLTIEHDDPAMLDRLEGVVAEHIARFAFRETLEFNWTRS
ncbi:DUF2218 domain-containing protein [Rhizobium alvei]|uniref:DUF2218 domain-containing protein n=1 Tax=Rhizobium alvei TaxID=1132659 RepID=A0ABT8YLT6_9HYPH|nr:DUF2218 domain-containing protein [Rhizobium alvei]MDO6964711.1 DUF2218 domain-containing protein [Rhizobium alvei]